MPMLPESFVHLLRYVWDTDEYQYCSKTREERVDFYKKWKAASLPLCKLVSVWVLSLMCLTF